MRTYSKKCQTWKQLRSEWPEPDLGWHKWAFLRGKSIWFYPLIPGPYFATLLTPYEARLLLERVPWWDSVLTMGYHLTLFELLAPIAHYFWAKGQDSWPRGFLMRPFFQKPKSLASSLVSVFLRPSGKRSAFLGSPKILTIEFPSYWGQEFWTWYLIQENTWAMGFNLENAVENDL